MSSKRIVVTGYGVVSPIGMGVEAFWGSLMAGRSGVRRITTFDTSGLATKIAGEIPDFEPTDYLDKKDAKRTDRFVQFAAVAALQAIADAKLTIDAENAERVGVLIGTGFGGLLTLMKEHETLLQRGADRVSPLLVPMMIPDMGSGYVSILTGAKGPNTTVVTACATGAHAVGDGAEILRRGLADVMIVGGSEACLHPIALAGFSNARAMTTGWEDDPLSASRPFDGRRTGFVGSEGAGVLILETEEHALARGAEIRAEVAGYGMTGDAHHIVQPDPTGDGVIRAMEMALAQSGLSKSEIDYVNAHATSTLLGDRAETQAYKKFFGDHAAKIAVSSTKSATGHMLGAAGAVEAIAAIEAIRHQTAPPTINQDTPDPECDLDYVPNKPRPMAIGAALSNNSGFGGHNAALIFKRYA